LVGRVGKLGVGGLLGDAGGEGNSSSDNFLVDCQIAYLPDGCPFGHDMCVEVGRDDHFEVVQSRYQHCWATDTLNQHLIGVVYMCKVEGIPM
jgi:hypothetical protein